jgi:hypothetical protein
MVDVINLGRNIIDAVRPFISPCSMVLLYVFTNMSSSFVFSHLCLVYLLLLGTHFSLSCYMLLFPIVTLDKNEFGNCLSFIWLCTRKCLNILDVNCFPLSCITLSGLPLIIIQSSSTLKTSTD